MASYNRKRQYTTKWLSFGAQSGVPLRCVISGQNVPIVTTGDRMRSWSLRGHAPFVFDAEKGQCLGPILESYIKKIDEGEEVTLIDEHVSHFLATQPYLADARLKNLLDYA